jgi:predicted Zn-dependent protease
MPFLDFKRKPAFFRAAAAATALAVAAASLPAPAFAQGKSKLDPVRDAEIEDLMRDYTTPLFRAAGLDPSAIEITLINDFSFNAFVANGRHIFINLGAIVESKTPNQLIGVLAHETGHIAGGHLSALREKLDAAGTRAIIATLLGVAAVAGAAMAGAGGNTIAGGANAAVSAPQSIVQRDLLAYVRAQEQAADQAGVSYLTKTGQSGKGMLETFKGFADKSMFTARFVDPYAVTHPMPQDRIALLERIVNASPSVNAKDDPALVHRHQMARAKIVAYMKGADSVARQYPASDTSLPARYARAVSAYRFGGVDDAQRQIDALIAVEPNNPYFWELKGQALLEAGRARQAVDPLQHAVSLKPKSGLIRMMLGEAMVATNDNSLLDSALTQLRQAIAYEPTASKAYRNLAIAYGRKGMKAEADVASAQSYFHAGDFTSAKQLAARAKSQLKMGSPAWLRADDIINYRVPKSKK